jgi:hypothetical protein
MPVARKEWQPSSVPPYPPEYRDRIEATGKAIARALNSDAVQNVNRWLRLPGTVNIPNDASDNAGDGNPSPALSRSTGRAPGPTTTQSRACPTTTKMTTRRPTAKLNGLDPQAWLADVLRLVREAIALRARRSARAHVCCLALRRRGRRAIGWPGHNAPQRILCPRRSGSQ